MPETMNEDDDNDPFRCEHPGCDLKAEEACPTCLETLCAEHFLGPRPMSRLHEDGLNCPKCTTCEACSTEKATRVCSSCSRWLCNDDYFGNEEEAHEATRQNRCRTCSSPGPIP
jgi:DNA-directed RNA polymerase subunit RPC12/RpoP